MCYENKEKIIVSQKENINFFKKITYDDFLEWVRFRIKNDWKYNNSDNFYCFLFLFEKKIVQINNKKHNLDLLEFWKPEYPWKNEWFNYFEKSIEKLTLLEKKITQLENELKKK